MVITQYVSHHKKIQCSSSYGSFGNWAWCFLREIALKMYQYQSNVSNGVKEALYVVEISCTDALMVGLHL